MKLHLLRNLLVLTAAALSAALPAALKAAVPLRWQVESSRVQPVSFDAIRGETLSLEASFNSYGTPLSMAGKPCSLYYQTNGMGSAWWTAPATAVSNRITATITPQMVPSSSPATAPGSTTATASGQPATAPVAIQAFLGSTGDIYRAAFTIRFRNGPGATPNVIEQPTPVLDLAHTVVINPPWPTTNDFRAATNDMQTSLKTYVDEQIVGAGVVSPQIVTNIVDAKIADKREKSDLHVYSQPVTRWFWSGSDAHQGWLDAANAIGNDASQPTHEGTRWECRFDYDDYRVIYSNDADENAVSLSFTLWHGWGEETEDFGTVYCNLTTMPSTVVSRFATTNDITSTVTKSYVESLGISSGVTSVNSKTGAVQLVASDVGAYPNSSGQQVASQVSTIGAHLNAEDARFGTTNYNSSSHMPEAYMEIKLPDNSWSRIWSEMTRWNYLFDSYLPTNYVTKAELAEKADRAWGYYESHTGSYAPEGYTWISSPRIAIAADLAYQRTITSEGAIWVLESNGLVTETGGVTSNGFFRITDDEGNTQFEIVKGSTRTIGANASSCQVVAGFSPTKLQIGYSVVSEAHPTIYVCASLSNMLWKAETDADCLANVTWSGSSGAYVAQVQAKTVQPSLFVKAEYETGSESLIRNVLPVELTHVYFGGVKYAVSTNTISGHIVLTLSPAP